MQIIQSIKKRFDFTDNRALHAGFAAVRANFGRHVLNDNNLFINKKRDRRDAIGHVAAAQGAWLNVIVFLFSNH